MEFLHRTAEHHTGGQEFNLGSSLRLLPTQDIGHVPQQGSAADLFLHLQQRICLEDWGCQQGISDTYHHKEASDAHNPPTAIDQVPQQASQIDLIVLHRSTVLPGRNRRSRHYTESIFIVR
ncbi:hypothetical protein D3C85_1029530 [compost metagenome]